MQNVPKLERFLAVISYMGIIGIISYIITTNQSNERFINGHAKQSSIIFIISIFTIPILKLINMHYFYLLGSLGGLIATGVFIILILFMLINLLRGVKGLSAISLSQTFKIIFFRTAIM